MKFPKGDLVREVKSQMHKPREVNKEGEFEYFQI